MLELLARINPVCHNGIMAGGDDGGGGFLSGIGDVLGEELKKLGQSATHQVTGNDPASQNTPTDDSSELAKIAKSLTGQVTGSAPAADTNTPTDHSLGTEVKKLGWDVVGQVTGHKHEQIEEAKAADKQFSEQELAQIRAKITAIYGEYGRKKKMEKNQQEQQKVQQEEQNKNLEQKQKKEDMDVSIAQQKASAENKNMGAE